MDLDQAILERRSVRRFLPELPPRQLVEEILHFACQAPSPMNRQDWHFAIIQDAELRASIVRAVEETWEALCAKAGGNGDALRAYQGNFSAFQDAPLLVAVSIKRTASFLESLLGSSAECVQGDLLSAGMAIQNLQLAARARGLGSCVFTGCVAAEVDIAKRIGLSSKRRLVCLVALGYPESWPDAPARRATSELVAWLEKGGLE